MEQKTLVSPTAGPHLSRLAEETTPACIELCDRFETAVLRGR